MVYTPIIDVNNNNKINNTNNIIIVPSAEQRRQSANQHTWIHELSTDAGGMKAEFA